MTKIGMPIILLIICFWPPRILAATLYLWTDDAGQMHITEKAPAAGNRIVDIMEYEPQPAKEAAPPPAPEKQQKSRLSEEKCRLAAQARRIARDARQAAAAAEARAEKLRQRAQDLKTRVGYDDELLDDYQDDIRELESRADRAQQFAEQAAIQAREADLKARRAKLEAGPDCRF